MKYLSVSCIPPYRMVHWTWHLSGVAILNEYVWYWRGRGRTGERRERGGRFESRWCWKVLLLVLLVLLLLLMVLLWCSVWSYASYWHCWVVDERNGWEWVTKRARYESGGSEVNVCVVIWLSSIIHLKFPTTIHVALSLILYNTHPPLSLL